MATLKQASIIGGGLAGLACGISLRNQGWEVAVFEKKRYPLKKVCGEFLSPKGWERVCALGADRYLALAPVLLAQARFYYSRKSYFDFPLEPVAHGLSREALDSALAARFKELGGQLREGEAFGGAEGIVIDASGRAGSGGEAKWIGWKGYLPAGAMQLKGILMLPLTGGYCGISAVEDGRLSVCFVARAPASVEALLRSHPILEPLASQIQFHASIAGFDFIRRPMPLKIGDSASVWPPLVGDGMSRALAAGMELGKALGADEIVRPGRDAVQFALSKLMHSLMLSPTRRLTGSLIRLAPRLAGRAYQWSRG